MSNIIDINGQPVTAEQSSLPEGASGEPGRPTSPAPAPRTALTPAAMQQIIGAYARLKELNGATILNTRDDAEKQGLINFLNGALLQNAEELFGCWVTTNQEYIPLITGFTALLHRALTRIDNLNQSRAQAQGPAVTETPSAA